MPRILETSYAHDFSGYPVGVNPADWTLRFVGSPAYADNGTWHVVAKANASAGRALRRLHTQNPIGVGLHMLVRNGCENLLNSELLVRFLLPEVTNQGVGATFMVRAREVNGVLANSWVQVHGLSDTGYYLQLQYGDFNYLSQAVTMAILSDRWYWLRLRVNTTSMQVDGNGRVLGPHIVTSKMWRDDGVEPLSWQATIQAPASYNALGVRGRTGVYYNQGNSIPLYFSDYTVTQFETVDDIIPISPLTPLSGNTRVERLPVLWGG